MAGIGRKYKRKMQGTSSYAKVKPKSPTPSNPPSVKRSRIRYKRNGGADAALKRTIANELEQCKQPLKISLRNVIYYYYIHRLDAPHEEHWAGKEGTISIIRKHLELPMHTRRKIRRTLEHIMMCIRAGTPFEGKLGTTTGRHILIQSGSAEEELIARWMESHLGFRMTTMLVNEHRREEGKERVGVSAVMNAFYRLQPKVTIIEKVQSGGLNKAWMDASYNIAKQMQIMMGRISEDEVMTDKEGTITIVYNLQSTPFTIYRP